jgi:hypothetical protein
MSKHKILLAMALGGCVLAMTFASVAAEKSEEGYLGVFLEPVPPLLAVHLGLAEGVGIVAADVAAESPADKAGVVQYDVVVSLNAKDVKGLKEFSEAVRQAGAGSKVKLGLIKKGQKKEIEVVLGALPDNPGAGKYGGPMGGRRLLKDGERPEDFLSPGRRGPGLPDLRVMPRLQPLPDVPGDMKPFVVPQVDGERLQALEDRMELLEKQQAEILQKLDKLLAK